ncbi:transcriptional regulator, HxlR family [Quadrisphaera granulorum]|uniref:HxlR family transcriptional regulator n=1 Tax=Quadrisphaera granulorum TaxID=317664 RepID=A0A316A5X6_9ACTN|nr:helix-turn-helix domain-containing protein [Quadrisphaera granulorum]PWJ53316.1 HxlR family transcriptional regulator [Quadrisphaera granulorum]SZE96990.1 transcriptional regulator, HxlR family [Quadrisphaera granulorum]
MTSAPEDDDATPARPTDELDDQQFVIDVFARACPSRSLLADVTGRWGTLAVLALADGTARFGALRRRVDGVSEKMLSQTLQALERDGLVVREVVSSIPPHVEYTLTPLGLRIAQRLHALVEVLEDAVPEVVAARAAHEARGRVDA